MTQQTISIEIPQKPSEEDLAKAVYELSLCVGFLPSRTEKELIQNTAISLVSNWWISKNNNEPPSSSLHEYSNWLEKPACIRKASKLGYQQHVDSN